MPCGYDLHMSDASIEGLAAALDLQTVRVVRQVAEHGSLTAAAEALGYSQPAVSQQLRRFEAREKDPLKSWKLTDEDWRNREKRPQYEQAVEDMVLETSTGFAPWTLVEADSKRYARVKVIETVIAAAEAGMRRHGMEIP